MADPEPTPPPEPPESSELVERALKPEVLMAIQRTAGNQAVAKLIEKG